MTGDGGYSLILATRLLMTYEMVSVMLILKLIEFHRLHGKLATLTAGAPGAIERGKLNIAVIIQSTREKAQSDGAPINAGYMVLSQGVRLFTGGDDCVFEQGGH